MKPYRTHNTTQRRSKFYFPSIILLLGVLLFSKNLCAQKVYLPKLDMEESIYFYHFDKKDAYSHHQGQDTVRMRIKIPSNVKGQSLFPGNAEINILKLKDTTLYSGEYMDKTKVYNPNDNYFLVIPPTSEPQIAELISYNISTLDFYMAPYITTTTSVEYHITRFVIDSQLGVVIAIGFIGGAFVLLMYFGISYVLNIQFEDFYYFTIYLASVIIYNFVQLDSFLKFYLLFPKNPIRYHQYFDFFSLFNYVIFILVLTRFLDLDEIDKKLAVRVRKLTLLIFLAASVFIVFGYLQDFKFMQTKLIVIYLFSLVIGCIILIDIFKNVKSKITILSSLGCFFFLIGLLGEFTTSRIFEESYFWNLERPIFGQIFPVNFTHFGNWVHLIFFSMIMGYKYNKTDKGILEMHNKKLEEMKKNTSKEIQKVEYLEKAVNLQESYLQEQNQVFDYLQTQVGSIKQQLNPIFLTNMINSSVLSIKLGENQKAKKQIALIKRFLEEIITLSESRYTTIEKDLKVLELFVELEKNRLHLDFSLLAENDIDNKHHIPPFLFQDYVEKIIWAFNKDKKRTSQLHIIGKKYEDHSEISLKVFHEGMNDDFIDSKMIIDRINNRLRTYDNYNYELKYNADVENQCTLLFKIFNKNKARIDGKDY